MDLIQYRRNSIYEYIERHGIITIDAISSALNISSSTVRRDVRWLESQNKIEIFHGGVTSKKYNYENFSMRMTKMSKEKKAIGEYAAKMVEDGDLIYIGGGSTTFEFAKALSKRIGLNGITLVISAINIATCFVNIKGFEVIIPGGTFISCDESMTSKITLNNLSKFNFDKVFTGIIGIEPEAGYTMPNFELAELKATLFNQSRDIFVLADYTKFGTIAPYKVRNLKKSDNIITNYNIEADRIYKKIKDKGVKVVSV